MAIKIHQYGLDFLRWGANNIPLQNIYKADELEKIVSSFLLQANLSFAPKQFIQALIKDNKIVSNSELSGDDFYTCVYEGGGTKKAIYRLKGSIRGYMQQICLQGQEWLKEEQIEAVEESVLVNPEYLQADKKYQHAEKRVELLSEMIHETKGNLENRQEEEHETLEENPPFYDWEEDEERRWYKALYPASQDLLDAYQLEVGAEEFNTKAKERLDYLEEKFTNYQAEITARKKAIDNYTSTPELGKLCQKWHRALKLHARAQYKAYEQGKARESVEARLRYHGFKAMLALVKNQRVMGF